LNGDPAFIPVSTFCLIKFSAEFLKVLDFKILFGAVQQDPEIFAIDAEFPANLVPIAFVEKDSFQEGSVPRGHTEQDLLDLDADLPRNCNGMGVGCGGCGLDCTLIIERLGAGGGAVVLEEDVITNGIDEGTETFRLAQGARPLCATGTINAVQRLDLIWDASR